MTSHTQRTLDALKASAAQRVAAYSGKTRIVVQVGHCSSSVGSVQVAEALASQAPDSAYIVTAGCDGDCYDAPRVVATTPDGALRVFGGVTTKDAGRILESTSLPTRNGAAAPYAGQHRVVLNGCGDIDPISIDEYLLAGGYAGLANALAAPQEKVIDEVKESGLLGRGGAYFPAAMKWESARKFPSPDRYVVVNCEEGEPGIFKDRHLMEGVPHRIIEGAIIAAYAAGVHAIYIYINAEAELSTQRMQQAVDQAAEAGIIGEDALGSGYNVSVTLRRGAGGYVCGEETTLLNTMEGDRREPRLRPPFPTEAGLFGKPTVINNAETLASVPVIMAQGAASFAEIGSEKATGTKVISLSGSVERPGVVEVPMGTTLREIVFGLGGGIIGGKAIAGVAVGGPSSGVLPESMLETAIAPGMLHESGVMLGAGGVIALDENVDVLEAVRSLAKYNADESCGKCTPCREGTPRMVDALDRLLSGAGSSGDLDELRELAEVVGAASLCGLGQAAGGPINSALHFFGDKLAALVEGK
jgi:NADH:ubiquinone oxidoreductase subunit F (NADH-binding)/(2Fe-2S) ferredoxin